MQPAQATTGPRILRWLAATLLLSPVACTLLAAAEKTYVIHRAGLPFGTKVIEMSFFIAVELAVLALGVAVFCVVSIWFTVRRVPRWDCTGPLIVLALVTALPFALAYRHWWHGFESPIPAIVLGGFFALWPRFAFPSLRPRILRAWRPG